MEVTRIHWLASWLAGWLVVAGLNSCCLNIHLVICLHRIILFLLAGWFNKQNQQIRRFPTKQMSQIHLFGDHIIQVPPGQYPTFAKVDTNSNISIAAITLYTNTHLNNVSNLFQR
jgi:hypothetical protein